MATSILRIGTRVELFNDLDLIAVLSLLQREVISRPDNYRKLRSRLSKWEQDIVNYGPGTIDFKLDTLSREEKEELQSLLVTVSDRINHFENSVPASFLMEHIEVPGVRFNDYPTAMLMTAIKTLHKLLIE